MKSKIAAVIWPAPIALRTVILAIIYFVPFSTLLTVWATRNFGGVYLWSSWKELLLATAAALGTHLLLTDEKLRVVITKIVVNRLIAIYFLLNLGYFVWANDHFKALAGLIFNCRFLLIFILAQIASYYFGGLADKLKKTILILGIIVASLAILLHFLPLGSLQSFGYDRPGINTFGIPPAYHLAAGEGSPVRAQSTLRGPNVFGAFLILPLAILLFRVFGKRRSGRLDNLSLCLVLAGLFLSYSRSAWLGAILTAGLVSLFLKTAKKYWLMASLVAMVLISIFAVRFWGESRFVRTVIFHQPISKTAQTEESNAGHLRNTTHAAADLRRHPFGKGLGTAGPVSVINGGQARVAENYFLQIFQETGWLGSVLLASVHLSLGLALWRNRANHLVLLAGISFAGLILTNLFLHTWADETVALTWWAYSGAVIGNGIMNKRRKYKDASLKEKTSPRS